MIVLRAIPAMVFLLHVSSALNYGGGGGGGYGGGGYGGGYQEEIPNKIIIKKIPKHVPIYKPVPYPKLVPVPKPVGFLKPFAIAKPFSVPHVVPVIKHFQKPFPVLKGVPFHFPIPLPKLVKLPFQIKIPKPYIVRVPKPYAVSKKFPVAVPVHIPKPYVVPIYKPVPVGVPHKVPKVINVYKEVPEYVKKPVPVYVEEQPYKPQGDHKGTPYVPSGGNKGSPFPSGIGGGHKGTPFPGGVGGGNKGSPFPSGGNGGYGNVGGGLHSKGTNPHATSAANFLAAHAGKLQSSHNSGYQDILAAYTQHQNFAGLQGLGGGIHGGYQGGQDLNGYGGLSGHNLDFQGGYGSHSQGQGVYEGFGGFDDASAYGRGAGVDKAKDSETSHEEGYGHNSGNEEGNSYDNAGHESNSYNEGQGGYNEGQGNGGYNNNQGYIGLSISSFNDHSGRGGGFKDEAAGGYNDQVGHDNQDYGINNNQGYDGNHNSGGSYGGQEGNGYQHSPTLSIYQLQNGAASTINFPNAASNYYNTGFQPQQSYGHQADSAQTYSQNHGGNVGYESQGVSDHQQSSYGPLQQTQENDGGYSNQESTYQNEGSYNNQDVGYQGSYDNQAHSESYHNQEAEASYNHPNLAPGLQSYGLRAAYPVQPGTDNQNQLQGAAGTVYVRAYDNNQGQPQSVSYSVKTSADNYQPQDSTQQNTYSSFTSTRNAVPAPAEKEPAEDKEPVAAASGRSYDVEDKPAISSGYSTLEGSEGKEGSWKVVKP
ncbi:hypothetical protein JTE90_012494 [Oedothorax gibbosus]|uniref:Uncharacterized protein n=1 Tax=Oedothorax gibbosus TaxID=931172 RepID=A0AAV6U5C0_9ARAC|nr:hypothetical protein JTE90_012494 [Oedothorax gibbosus]